MYLFMSLSNFYINPCYFNYYDIFISFAIFKYRIIKEFLISILIFIVFKNILMEF